MKKPQDTKTSQDRKDLQSGFRLVYDLVVSTIVWLVLVPWQLLEILRGRSSWTALNQRLGRARAPQKQERKRLLIHAVSVGEVGAAHAIVKQLTEEANGLEIILTAGNRDGKHAAERLKQRYHEIRDICLLPWDRAPVMSSWLQRLQPDLVVVVETEIWPNLFLACRKLKIPLYIVNGRIYPRDLTRYRLAKAFFQPVLSCAQWIGVQNARERERFLQIGAARERVHVVGNLKFDTPQPALQSLGPWEEQLPRARPLLVAASTHGREERWLLESLDRVRRTLPRLRLVLAPRHTGRAPQLEQLARQFGFRTAIWSRPQNGDAEDWDALVLDQMGFLSAIYVHADLVVMGGSFVNRGGHNFLEAAACGCAIVTGPYVEHFEDLVEKFQSEGALLMLPTHRELDAALQRLLLDAAERKKMGCKAQLLFESARGISDVYVRRMRGILNTQSETSALPNMSRP